MDIYAYNMYDFNQSDELAKQLYAQQALSTLPSQRPLSEPHSMPSPSGAPWNVQGIPWGSTAPTSLVQFTAQPSTSGLHLPPVIHCKRKSLDPEPAIPAKQLITEEKMAAHLNGLHISSDYTNYASSSFQTDEMMEDVPASIMLTDKIKVNKIVIADEIKKLQKEPLIPPSLLERLEKPCMSLVVWKPKEDILDIKSKTETNNNNSDDNEEMNEQPKRRNGLLVAESVGTMDVEM